MAQYDGAENGLRMIPGCPTLPVAIAEHRSSAGESLYHTRRTGASMSGVEFLEKTFRILRKNGISDSIMETVVSDSRDASTGTRTRV